MPKQEKQSKPKTMAVETIDDGMAKKGKKKTVKPKVKPDDTEDEAKLKKLKGAEVIFVNEVNQAILKNFLKQFRK